MNMQTDDWRGEHLIRTQKRPEPQEIIAPGSPAHSAAAVLARKVDADKIRPLATKHTRAEIHRMTGLTMNRIYFICSMFKIAPMEHASSPKKRKLP